jgi:hypothetical protein
MFVKKIFMKNTIYIDVDTEREQHILIGKGPENEPPANKGEAAKMIVNDIACVCEALCTLIQVADQNDYAKKDELITESIKQLTKMLVQETKKDNKEN